MHEKTISKQYAMQTSAMLYVTVPRIRASSVRRFFEHFLYVFITTVSKTKLSHCAKRVSVQFYHILNLVPDL